MAEVKELAPSTEGAGLSRTIPHSQDAERALLGALLLNNSLYHELDGHILPEHFYVPAHGRVYNAVARLIERDQVADPVSLSSFFGSAEWFSELGGTKFLQELHENATSIINVRTYGDIIYNHFLNRQLIQVGTDLVNKAYDQTQESPTELIGEAEGALFSLAEQGHAHGGFEALKNPLVRVIEQVEQAKRSRGGLSGITSGFDRVDDLMGGFQNSDLVILAARPSMGKTSLALNFALNAAQAQLSGAPGGAGVAVFTLEMSMEQLASRLLSSSSGISGPEMASGKISPDKFQDLVRSCDELSQLRLFIDDTPQLSISQVRSRARRLKRRENIGLVVIDYLQLMRGSSVRRDGNRVQEISEISQGLKTIARELNVPVIALSQLSRNVESRENKRPQLSDLRESGSIEQDADIVMFLYREAYYKEREFGTSPTPEQQAELNAIRHEAELLISKNRKGATGQIKLVFDGATTTFHNHTGAAY